MSRKSQHDDDVSKLNYLIGKLTVRSSGTNDWVKSWLDQKGNLDKFVSVGDSSHLAGLIGLLEGIDNEMTHLEGLLEKVKEQIAQLEHRPD
jgi:hypothetical protein